MTLSSKTRESGHLQELSDVENLKVVFLSDWLANPYKKLLASNLNHHGVQVEEYKWNLIFLPRVLSQGKPNILHFHTLHRSIIGRNPLFRLIKLIVFISQLLILSLLGTKFVWTVHEWSDKLHDGKNNITPIQAEILANYLDAIIAHCDTTKQEIIQSFRLENTDKVFVVPHGNYIQSYENKVSQLEARRNLGIPDDNLVFLLFGSIYRYKGVLEAIDAFKYLQQDAISLLIAGKPNQDLEEEISAKIKEYKNILFVPKRIPDNEVQVYMNACDCVVLPYQVFTTSGVAILAMSFGRACIAPNVGFFSDMLDESGSILYDSNDREGLLHGMKYAMEERSKLLDMGKYNFTLADKWNWAYVAEETFNIYRRILNV